ncbi:MAG TPA: EAL domain-containing protein [Azospirillaceae bacterium]|nr:EAL domain-containing protein [Azospirillaceae bacterium]
MLSVPLQTGTADDPAADMAAEADPAPRPGVQPHGWLLVLDDGYRVLQAGCNLAELCGVAVPAAIGRTAEALLGRPAAAALEAAVEDSAGGSITPVQTRVETPGGGLNVHLQAHWGAGGLIVEIEPWQMLDLGVASGFLSAFGTAIRRYHAAPDVLSLARAAARDARILTGFDMAAVIRFDAEERPELIAQDAEPGTDPFAGRTVMPGIFPDELRAIYTLTRLRLVSDTEAPMVPLHPPANPATGLPLDLSRAWLRGLTPLLHDHNRRAGVRGVLSISLVVGGRLWGLVACYNRRPRIVAPPVRALCEAMGEIVAAQIGALAERAVANDRVAAARALARLSQSLRASTDLARTLWEERQRLAVLFDHEALDLRIGGDERTDGAASAATRDALLTALRNRALDGVVAVADCRLLLDAGAAPEDWPGAALFMELPHAGHLLLTRGRRGPWSAAKQEAAHELHRLLAERGAELYRASAEERLHRLAYFDPVTELPNRAHMLRDIQAALAEDRHPALLVASLDRFRTLKGSLGDDLADRLLAAVARRLAGCLGEGDLLARVDTGEFAVLVPEESGADAATRLGSRIREALRTPVALDGRDLFVTASLGLVPAAGPQALPQEMLRNAEIAAFEAEASGGGTKAFEGAMRARLTERYDLYDQLRHAVYFGQGLTLAYQPIVNLADCGIAGFEVLARWNHPERGPVPPSDFIPIAEETGLIVPLGNQILVQACRQIARWRRMAPQRDLYLSVNLSPYQLDGAKLDLPRWVQGVLEMTGAKSDWLKLEVTESGLIGNAAKSVDVLHRLRRLGIGLAIDDFGTGYSSLSYLQRLPLEALKIDRSFITEMDRSEQGAEVVRTILQLARILDLSVVAEGVESRSHLERLRALGCARGQGYLFSKPVDSQAAEQIVCGREPWIS